MIIKLGFHEISLKLPHQGNKSQSADFFQPTAIFVFAMPPTGARGRLGPKGVHGNKPVYKEPGVCLTQ